MARSGSTLAGWPRAAALGGALLLSGLAGCGRPAPAPATAPAADALAWAYPGKGPGATAPRATAPIRLSGSSATYTEAGLHDLFSAVDWRPADHPPAPTIVLRGRKPDAMACGYCHLPDGQGRPENAALAGLPAAYIEAQVLALRAGERRGVHPEWVPSALMTKVAGAVTPDELTAAATYFSRLTYTPRVRVVEAADMPRMEPFGFMYRPLPGTGREPVGTRVIETPDDPGRWEKRDSRVTYTAYAPVGAVARGRALASGETGRAPACASCHGEGLRGGPAAPPIAGRMPGYLFRQLAAFRAGTRHAARDAPMQAVAGGLTTAEMVDVAAYAATVKP